MATDSELFALAGELGRKLRDAGLRLVTAESCTGGWLAKAVTDIAGSSQWFERGYVTYSNEAKVRDLGVGEETLVAHGAVSDAVVREMALGALRVSGAEVALSVSGIAGPDGATPGKPVGTVWFGIAVRRAEGPETMQTLRYFGGDRESVRRSAVECALQLLIEMRLVARGKAATAADRP